MNRKKCYQTVKENTREKNKREKGQNSLEKRGEIAERGKGREGQVEKQKDEVEK